MICFQHVSLKFRDKRSCILKSVDVFYDNGHETDVYLNILLSKAFHTVLNGRLLLKLKSLGFDGK